MGTECPLHLRMNSRTLPDCFSHSVLASEISKGPIEIISIVKIINDLGFNHYDELMLPSPVYPNLHMYGPYPVDVERWRYTDPFLAVEGKYLHIPNGLKNKVLEEGEEILGKEVVSLIAEKIRRKAIIYGSNFSAWSFSFKQKWMEKWTGDGKKSVMVYDKMREPLGNIQVDHFIKLRSMNPVNWRVNPEFINSLSSWGMEEEIECKIPIGGYSRKVTVVPSEIQEAKKECHKILLRMLEEKKKLFQNAQGWRFRINKLSVKKKINIDELSGSVLYFGKFIPFQDEWFFADAYFTREFSDYVSVKPFDAIGNITSPVVGLLGEVMVENKEVKIFPFGFLTLL